MRYEVITTEPTTTVDTTGHVSICGYKKEIVEGGSLKVLDGVVYITDGYRPTYLWSIRNLVSIRQIKEEKDK